eukprot:scaffold1302_cov113-Skeletonema_marinoi.AAC.4
MEWGLRCRGGDGVASYDHDQSLLLAPDNFSRLIQRQRSPQPGQGPGSKKPVDCRGSWYQEPYIIR